MRGDLAEDKVEVVVGPNKNNKRRKVVPKALVESGKSEIKRLLILLLTGKL
jgi:hypothetical protein